MDQGDSILFCETVRLIDLNLHLSRQSGYHASFIAPKKQAQVAAVREYSIASAISSSGMSSNEA